MSYSIPKHQKNYDFVHFHFLFHISNEMMESKNCFLLLKRLLFWKMYMNSINQKQNICVKNKKNMKIYYCKKKKRIFCLKCSIFIFCTTDKMKSVSFSKNIQSLMLSEKCEKNRKKYEKKRCFKLMKKNFFFLLRIEIFFKKKVLKRHFFSFFHQKRSSVM